MQYDTIVSLVLFLIKISQNLLKIKGETETDFK